MGAREITEEDAGGTQGACRGNRVPQVLTQGFASAGCGRTRGGIQGNQEGGIQEPVHRREQ